MRKYSGYWSKEESSQHRPRITKFQIIPLVITFMVLMFVGVFHGFGGLLGGGGGGAMADGMRFYYPHADSTHMVYVERIFPAEMDIHTALETGLSSAPVGRSLVAPVSGASIVSIMHHSAEDTTGIYFSQFPFAHLAGESIYAAAEAVARTVFSHFDANRVYIAAEGAIIAEFAR